MRKYVSDVITVEEISKWENGDNIRVLGATGSGKSYWALHTLAPYCRKQIKDNNEYEKVLYLVHRVALRRQVIKDTILSVSDDVVSVMTYQNIIMQQKNGILDLSDYDVIIYDEFQFLINDSDYVADTEIIFNIMSEKTHHRQVFISANDMYIGMNFDREYKIGDTTKDISDRINNAFLLPHNSHISSLIGEILDNTDDKIFCYINNNAVIKELYNEYNADTMLYVSNNSPLSSKMSEVDTEIFTQTNKLNKRLLLTTSAFDAGVSIKDDKVKHIIVEERDLEQLYQVIGRKRLEDNEKFDLYIVNMTNQRIAGYQTQLKKDVENIRMFADDKYNFCRLHGRDKLDNTIFYNDEDGNLELNIMATFKLGYLAKQYNRYLEYGYKNVIESEFNINLIDIAFEKKQEDLESYLKSVVGKRLQTKEEKDELIDKIDYRFNGRQYRTPNKLNEGLQSENMNYIILTKKSNSVRYWVVEVLQE